MKSNKGLYILLPIVALVWGIIIYRVVKYVGSDKIAITEPVLNEVNFEPEKFQKDTFSIVADYRDPFLSSSVPIKSSQPTSNKNNTSPVQISSKPKSQMPTIVFKGIVKNKKSGNTLAVLKINDKTKTLCKGQVADDIHLLNVTRDSILVMYAGTKNIIHRKVGTN